MSTVERRGKSWVVRFRHAGKSMGRSFPSETLARKWQRILDAAGADAALAILEDDAASRDAIAEMTVARWVGQHIDSLTGVTEGTRREYRSYLARNIAPHAIGALPLAALSRDAAAAWVNDLERQGLSGKSVKNRHSLLSGACRAAVRAGRLPANPAEALRMPRSIGKDLAVLTPDEFAILLHATPERWRPLIAVLGGTGLRWGEATALRVRDLDLNAQPPILRVEQAWKRSGKAAPTLGPPKTRMGRRTVAIPRELLPDLRALIDGHKPDEWVFTNSRGGPVRSSTFHDKHWPGIKARARELGLQKDVHPHLLRHSHAVWMTQAGVPLPQIQRRMGHESIQTTVNTYGAYAPDMHDASLRAASLALTSAYPAIEG